MLTPLTEIKAAGSLPAALFTTVEHFPTRQAQWRLEKGAYAPITYEHLATRIRHVATGLIRAGVKPGDRVALLMDNIPEWAVVDYAVLSVGAVTVPLYCSYRAQDMAYVIKDAEAKLAVASKGRILGHLVEAAKSCPTVQAVYAFEDMTECDKCARFEELEAGEVDVAELDRRLQALSRDTLATLVYTSGTTGDPKGVMLSHGNILANLEAILETIPLYDDDKFLSFLPLAHSFERMAGHFLPYSLGLSVAFAERPDTVATNLPMAKPTLLLSVPRLFEVIRSRIMGKVAKESGLKQKLFHGFLNLAEKKTKGTLSWWEQLPCKLLDSLVGEKIRQRFGGSLRLLVSGGAPLSIEVAEFFERVGLPILEGYGMTEAAPLISVNPVDDRRFGSIGKPVPNVEVKIAKDGEILAHGPNIMQGYWKLPEKTKETVVKGWLHTGDIGEMDEEGYIRITDRKKDIIVNSGGENVAPQRIESKLVSEALIEQIVIFGDQKPYLVALVVPAEEACMAWAKEEGLPETDWEKVATSDILRKYLQTRINELLKGFTQQEQIRRILIHPQPFTIDEGLMTPTMKIKRHPVYERFKDDIEALY